MVIKMDYDGLWTMINDLVQLDHDQWIMMDYDGIMNNDD